MIIETSSRPKFLVVLLTSCGKIYIRSLVFGRGVGSEVGYHESQQLSQSLRPVLGRCTNSGEEKPIPFYCEFHARSASEL